MKYNQQLCPCGSRKPYCECCLPIHRSIRSARSPADIVRARFAAMALGDMMFFRESIIKKHRHFLDAEALLAATSRQIFRSISIIHIDQKGVLGGKAIVHSRITKGKRGRLTTHGERTYLRRELLAWRVVEIDLISPDTPPPKNGRNVLCPCGSGRKYKHCCGSTQKLQL